MNNVFNKFLIIIITIIVLIVGFILFYYLYKDDNKEILSDDNTNLEYSYNINKDVDMNNIDLDGNMVYLTVEQFNGKVNNEETFGVVIVQKGCSHCHTFLPILTEVVTDFYINNIYAMELTDYRMTNFNANISGTPTTIFINGGEYMGAGFNIVGSRSRENTIESLKLVGYIK